MLDSFLLEYKFQVLLTLMVGMHMHMHVNGLVTYNLNEQPLDEDCVQEDMLEHMFEKQMGNNFLRHLWWC